MTPPGARAPDRGRRTIRVLVIDDDFRVARVHADAVASLPDCEVVALAHTAEEAVRLAAEHRPDLVLLDEYLPDASGISVLPALHAAAIVVSAAGDTHTVRRAIEAGAVNYVLKPFPLRVLVARVGAFARLHWALDEQRPMDQGDIDHALALVRGANEPGAALPKGRSAVTAAAIRDALREGGEPLTAARIAEVVGVSRATAQRYLADLVKSGQVTLTLRYGTTGRPEHCYEWRG